MADKSERELFLKKAKALWADKRSYKNRLVLAGAAMLAACFTFIFFGPFEMVAFGVNSLVFTYKDVVWLLAAAASVVFIVGILLIAMLKGKIHNYVVSVIFAITLGGYLQATFFNGSVGALTGEAVEWSKMKPEMALSLIMWISVLLLVFTVLYFHRTFWRKLIIGASFLLVVMQFVPMVGIITGMFEDAKIPDGSAHYFSEAGLNEYSSEENVFVFVVDYTDYDYIASILATDPSFFDSFDGFIGYSNAIATYGRTRPSVCNILTGYTDGAYIDPGAEYMREAWNAHTHNIFDILKEKGYSIELYGSIADIFSSAETAKQYVLNVCQKNENDGAIIPGMMLKKLIYLSVYRYAPMVIKPFFLEYTSFYNDDVYSTSRENTPYVSDDIAVTNVLTDAVANRQESCFKFYHLRGAHPPCNLNRNGEDAGMQTNEYAQTMGCLTLLKNVIGRMKDLGIYEDATIIITADHGDAVKMWQDSFTGMQIAMFYKPAGSAGSPMVWSDAQVSTSNIPATIARAVGADYTQFGKALDDVGDETVERTFFRVYGNNHGRDEEVYVDRYTIHGNAGDFSNWKLEETIDVLYPFY